jgi:hypothetical protein
LDSGESAGVVKLRSNHNPEDTGDAEADWTASSIESLIRGELQKPWIRLPCGCRMLLIIGK